ncbi:TPA: restriction endonuclease subunit S [Pseudomonas aeruginosa]|nr:restriction endonuclease subunit S [Pseudomonas aeruginosa]HEK2056610.1 restriction endonuclease subunit S [Pseudomonas aeruginosa]
MSWPLVKISDFCQTGSGGTPSRDIPEYYEGDIPWIKSGDLRENIVTSATEFISQEAINKSSAKIVSQGAILVAMYGATVGRMALLGIDAATNQAVCNVVPDASKADTKYVYYALLSKVPDFLRSAIGGAQPNISQGLIRSTEIPLPPLPEQKRIAAILDKADAIRRKRQQAIQLADDFLRAVFLDMFGDPVTNPKGWPVDKFGNVFDVRDGTHDSPSYVSSGFPLITSKNIKNGEIDMLDVNYISKEDYELINRRSKVDVGDILMPMIGTIGNPAIVRDEPLFAIKNVALIKLGRSSLPAEFVLALLNGPLLEAAVQQKSRGGTQKFLGLGDIRDLNCYLPDERLVSKYIGIANKVRQFASAYRKADEAGLEGSLSQKAFSGHL